MITYLVTFSNIFDHAKFTYNTEDYFMTSLDRDIVIIHHNSKFCEIQTKYIGYLDYRKLKTNFPGIKILLKQHFGKRVKYAKL